MYMHTHTYTHTHIIFSCGGTLLCLFLDLFCSHLHAFWHVTSSFGFPALWNLTSDSFSQKYPDFTLLLQRPPTWPASHLLHWDWSSKFPAGFSSCLGYLEFCSCECRASPRICYVFFEWFLFLLHVAWPIQGKLHLFSFCLCFLNFKSTPRS